MTALERAFALVYEAIDVVNRQLPPARRLRKAPDTIIVGAGGALDSLAVINFVLTLEERVAAAGSPVALLDEDTPIEQSPLQTVDTVARYIAKRVA